MSWTQYDPNNRDAWMCLAVAATELDDHATRADALQVLIRFEPDEFRHYEALTVSLGKLERWSELTDHCREWLDREPESQNAHAWYLLGLSRSKQHNKVIAHFEQGWPNADSNTIAIQVVVRAYNDVGRYPDAIAAAARILGRKDCPDETWREQAEALLKLGHYDAAAAAARRYLQSDPNREFTVFTLFILAEALMSAKQYEEALPVVERWLALEPTPSAWSRKVKALLGLQRYEEAATTAEALAAMAPADPAAVGLIASALARTGNRRMVGPGRHVEVGSFEAPLPVGSRS